MQTSLGKGNHIFGCHCISLTPPPPPPASYKSVTAAHREERHEKGKGSSPYRRQWEWLPGHHVCLWTIVPIHRKKKYWESGNWEESSHLFQCKLTVIFKGGWSKLHRQRNNRSFFTFFSSKPQIITCSYGPSHKYTERERLRERKAGIIVSW
jgi:hypothetical protein